MDAPLPSGFAGVDRIDAPIHRANHMFRLIEDPAGASRVELRYRPASVAVGGAISAVTLGALALICSRARGRAGGRPAGRCT